MTGKSRSAIFRFTYSEQGDAYLVVNPNSDEGEGFIEIDTVRHEIRGYNPVHRIYQGWGKYAGYKGYFVVSYQKPLEEFGTFIGDTVFPGKTALSDRKKSEHTSVFGSKITRRSSLKLHLRLRIWKAPV